MTLPIVFHPDYQAPLKRGHRFPMSKYGYLARLLEGEGLRPTHAPEPATGDLLSLTHEAGYVGRVLDRTLSEDETRKIGLPATEAVARRARLASAGTLLAAELALETGRACNAAGGSHHAERARGAGYCVFNDVAVAASALLASGRVGRILVVDLDVHQGDGTASIFRGDPRVFTLSVHAERNFPARKAASNLDVGLPDGIEDATYLAVLDETLEAAEARFAPDLIFYNAGVDVHRDDRLGRLSLSDEGLNARDRRVMAWAAYMGAPLVGVLGGGYGAHPGEIAARHVSLFRAAAEI